MDRRMVEYEAKKQTPLVAYILLVVFGLVGAHNFYLGRRQQALAQLLFSVVMAGAMLWLFVGFASAEMGDLSGDFDSFVRRAWTFYAVSVIWGIRDLRLARGERHPGSEAGSRSTTSGFTSASSASSRDPHLVGDHARSRRRFVRAPGC